MKDSEPTFEDIRSGAVLPGGGFAVADAGANRVLLLSYEGRVVGELGQSGQGPGEFQRIGAVIPLSGDSLLVQDERLLRLSVFHGGGLVREATLPGIVLLLNAALGHTSGGEIVFGPHSFSAGREDPGWIQAPILRLSLDFEGMDTLALFSSFQVRQPTDKNPFRYFGATDMAGARVVHARNDRPEVFWLDESGQVEQIARWDPGDTTVDEGMWEEYERAVRSQEGRELRGDRLDQLFAERKSDGIGALLPIFRFLFGDSEGNVWLSHYSFAGQPAKEYSVLDSSGRWLGSVPFPDRFQPLDISSEFILGIERDEWDVQAVSVYRVLKGGGAL